MKRRIWIGLLASILLALSHKGLEAQVQVGGQLLHNEEITGGSMGFGARAWVPVSGFAITGDLTWYFPDCGGGSCEYWEALAGATYTFFPGQVVSPYVGGGLGFQRFSITSRARSDTPRHIMGGIRLNAVGRTTPYLEGSYRNGDELGDQVVASLGILF